MSSERLGPFQFQTRPSRNGAFSSRSSAMEVHESIPLAARGLQRVNSFPPHRERASSQRVCVCLCSENSLRTTMLDSAYNETQQLVRQRMFATQGEFQCITDGRKSRYCQESAQPTLETT
jgi:hypothetical protein